MLHISFPRLAERELRPASAFYREAAAGLDDAFLDEVERCLAGISDHPFRGTRVGREIRRALPLGFPYALLYRARRRSIRILAVVNLRRRPSYWIGRR